VPHSCPTRPRSKSGGISAARGICVLFLQRSSVFRRLYARGTLVADQRRCTHRLRAQALARADGADGHCVSSYGRWQGVMSRRKNRTATLVATVWQRWPPAALTVVAP
jgi:hypothetical protein